MSVTAFELTFSGGTIEQYEQVIEKMGFEHHGRGPTGALFHWVAKTDDGMKVVDVWESPELFEAFAESTIRPYSKSVGLQEPEVTSHAVHNYLVGPDL